MEKKKEKVYRIKVKMSDPKGLLLPRGRIDELSLTIADGVVMARFTDNRNTKRFARVIMELEKKRGASDTVYLERLLCMVTKYPNKNKDEIKTLLLSQLKQLGINANDRSK